MGNKKYTPERPLCHSGVYVHYDKYARKSIHQFGSEIQFKHDFNMVCQDFGLACEVELEMTSVRMAPHPEAPSDPIMGAPVWCPNYTHGAMVAHNGPEPFQNQS